jgi:ABC-type nitrate/sulfonate/bicarbonate transport system ATPase subunit/ABC-type nitrate/sulfonate/bicarbonate transport system permease component
MTSRTWIQSGGRQLRAPLKWAAAAALFLGTLELLHLHYGLPSPKEVLQGVRSLWDRGYLGQDVAVSGARWLFGWAVGATVGVLLGFLTGRSVSAATVLEGFLVLCRAIPFISLVPLTIQIFGLAESKFVVLVAWAVGGVCWIYVHESVRALPPQLEWRSRTLGIRRLRWILHVLVPSSADAIQGALRTSLALGWIVVAVAESSGVYERSSGIFWSEGLGYRIFYSLDAGRDEWLLASILLFAAVGIVADQLFIFLWSAGSGLRHLLQAQSARKAVSRAVRHAETPNAERVSNREVAARKVNAPNPRPFVVRSLYASYNDKRILSGFDLDVPAGCTLAVIAPSGSGKTTLLKALAHLRSESLLVTGEVRLGDEMLRRTTQEAGLVMQDAPVFGHMTAWAHVALGARVAALPREEREVRVWHLLTEFGLAELAPQSASALSGGERQRLALATALANQPDLLLLDEPFGALDAITRRHMQLFYTEHVSGRTTAVFVTHDVVEALIVGDLLRVGVATSSETITLPHKGPIAQWERSDTFQLLRNRVLDALDQISPIGITSAGVPGRERP